MLTSRPTHDKVDESSITSATTVSFNNFIEVIVNLLYPKSGKFESQHGNTI